MFVSRIRHQVGGILVLGGMSLLTTVPVEAQPQKIQRAIARAAIAVARPLVEPAAQDQEQKKEEALPTGALDELDSVLAAAAELRLENDRLKVVRVSDMQSFQSTFYSNAHLFGGGGSSSSSNGQQWTMSFQWNRLQGQATLSQQADSSLGLDLTEQDGLRRSMRYLAEAGGRVELELWSPSTASLIRFRQAAEGPIRMTVLTQDRAVDIEAATVSAALQGLGVDGRSEFLDSVRRLGMPFPPTRYDAPVMQAVLSRLAQPVEAATVESFRSWVADFDADDFAARQACSERLKREFNQWKAVVMEAIGDESFSLEARARMREALRAASSEDADIAETIADQRLLEDVDYLILLLGDAPEDAANRIANRLRAITGQTFDDSLEAWRSWRGVPEAAVAASTTETMKPFSQDGRLEQLKDSIGSLARFKAEEGHWQLDQSLWREPYGGRTIAEVNQEIKSKLEEYRLPPSLWHGEQLQNLGDAAYPVALMMAMEPKVQALPAIEGVFHHMSTNYYVTPNPQFSINGIAGSLATQGAQNQNGQVEAAGKEIHFSLSETAGTKRSLRFGISVDSGNSYVAVRDPAAEFLVCLSGSKQQGWTLQTLQGGAASVVRASTTDELRAANAQVFDELLLPALARYGVAYPQ